MADKEVVEVNSESKVTDLECQEETTDFIPTDQRFSKCSPAHQTLLGMKVYN